MPYIIFNRVPASQTFLAALQNTSKKATQKHLNSQAQYLALLLTCSHTCDPGCVPQPFRRACCAMEGAGAVLNWVFHVPDSPEPFTHQLTHDREPAEALLLSHFTK